jgi:hypothetical protein
MCVKICTYWLQQGVTESAFSCSVLGKRLPPVTSAGKCELILDGGIPMDIVWIMPCILILCNPIYARFRTYKPDKGRCSSYFLSTGTAFFKRN